MEHLDVVRMGLIFAVQTEIEGMKVANSERDLPSEAVAYTEEAFQAKAEEIRDICYRPNERL